MEKVAFNKKKTLFTSKTDLNSRKKTENCFIWSIALYGVDLAHFGNRIRNIWGV